MKSHEAATVTETEVLILGGGPGGSTLAASLAMKGRKPLVLEREQFPRFHIGESLLPRSMEIIEKLGLKAAMDEKFLRKYGARFCCSATGRTASYRFAEAFDPTFPHAYQVERAEFDELLLRHAQKLGADVRERWEARDVLFDGDRAIGARVRDLADPGREHVIHAKVVVDATGRDTLVASKTRRKATIAQLDKTAFYTQYSNAWRGEGEAEGDIQIVVFDHGWFWVIPFKNGRTSVGVVVTSDYVKTRGGAPGGPRESLDAFFERTVAQSSFMLEFLKNAKRELPVGALADFSYRIDQLTGDGWLFVGDSGGFLDPLFSTGAHLAIKGADLAADAIDRALATGDTSRAAFAGYERAVRDAVDLFLGSVQGFYAGELREMIFSDHQRTTMRKLVTSMLSGDVFHGPEKPRWTGYLTKQFPAELPTFG